MSNQAAFTRALIAQDREPLNFVEVAARYKNDHLALSGITCQFEHGTSTALMGPNGSGKTTLLRVMCGLTPPCQGAINPDPSRKSVALVAQLPERKAWLPVTVNNVLRMSRYRDRGLVKRIGPADRIIIEDAAERLEVLGLLHRQFGELSGGQRQRVMVAQALAQDADVLLMDEPITGLDLPSQETILRIIDDERRRGRIVVITTHHMDEAEVCDQVLLLANRMIAAGTPKEVLTNKNLREAFGIRTAHSDHEDDALFDEHAGHSEGMIHVFDDHRHDHG